MRKSTLLQEFWLHEPANANVTKAYRGTTLVVFPQLGNRPRYMTNTNQALAEELGVQVLCAPTPHLSLPRSLAYGLPGVIHAYRRKLTRTLDHIQDKLPRQNNIVTVGHSYSGALSIIAGLDPRVAGVVSLAPSGKTHMSPRAAMQLHASYNAWQANSKPSASTEREKMGVPPQVAPAEVLRHTQREDQLHGLPLLVTDIACRSLELVCRQRPDLPIAVRYPNFQHYGDWDMDGDQLDSLVLAQRYLGTDLSDGLPQLSVAVDPTASHNSYDNLQHTLEPVRLVLDRVAQLTQPS